VASGIRTRRPETERRITRALLRQSAIQTRAARDKRLKKRTLTNLYNERPGWLKLAHRKLDEAVLAAYAAVDGEGDWDTAWAAAYEPFGAGEIMISDKEPPEVEEAKRKAIEDRREIDEKILGNLLRLNLQRGGEETPKTESRNAENRKPKRRKPKAETPKADAES